jgi:hypothetical protein
MIVKTNDWRSKMSNVVIKGRLASGAKKLFEGEENQYGKFEYSALVILDDESIAKVEAAKAEALADTFGNKIPKNLQDWVIREGDDEEYEASFGKKFINAKKKGGKAPQVLKKVGGVKEQIFLEDDVLYSGCYVAAVISIYAYTGDPSKKIQPGVSCGLEAVMFVRDGERLGRPEVNVDEAFEGIESELDDEF